MKRFNHQTARESIFKILKELISASLGRQCSLKGRNNNFKLEGTNVLAMVKGMLVCKHSEHRLCTCLPVANTNKHL